MCTREHLRRIGVCYNTPSRFHKAVFIEVPKPYMRMAMSEIITLEVPDGLARNARAVARQTHRRVEEVLVEWLARAASDIPVEQLSDDQVLALRDMQMDDAPHLDWLDQNQS